MTDKLTIAHVARDEFGVVAGPGFVILNHGKRLDWPMLTTRREAEADLAGFIREWRQLRSDEASERGVV